MLILSVKNEKLGFFNRPVYCESRTEALSYIQNILMSDADRALVGLKDDLALYHLGSIDFETGFIDALAIPVKVCDLKDIFETIPKDRIPRFEKEFKEAFDNMSKYLESTKDTLAKIEELFGGDFDDAAFKKKFCHS